MTPAAILNLKTAGPADHLPVMMSQYLTAKSSLAQLENQFGRVSLTAVG